MAEKTGRNKLSQSLGSPEQSGAEGSGSRPSRGAWAQPPGRLEAELDGWGTPGLRGECLEATAPEVPATSLDSSASGAAPRPRWGAWGARRSRFFEPPTLSPPAPRADDRAAAAPPCAPPGAPPGGPTAPGSPPCALPGAKPGAPPAPAADAADAAESAGSEGSGAEPDDARADGWRLEVAIRKLDSCIADVFALRRRQDQMDKKQEDIDSVHRGQLDCISERIYAAEKHLRQSEERQEEAIGKASATFQKQNSDLMHVINQVNLNFEHLSAELSKHAAAMEAVEAGLEQLRDGVRQAAADAASAVLNTNTLRQDLAAIELSFDPPRAGGEARGEEAHWLVKEVQRHQQQIGDLLGGWQSLNDTLDARDAQLQKQMEAVSRGMTARGSDANSDRTPQSRSLQGNGRCPGLEGFDEATRTDSQHSHGQGALPRGALAAGTAGWTVHMPPAQAQLNSSPARGAGPPPERRLSDYHSTASSGVQGSEQSLRLEMESLQQESLVSGAPCHSGGALPGTGGAAAGAAAAGAAASGAGGSSPIPPRPPGRDITPGPDPSSVPSPCVFTASTGGRSGGAPSARDWFV